MPSGPCEAPFFDLGVSNGWIKMAPMDPEVIEEKELPDHALGLEAHPYRGSVLYLDRHDATCLMMAIQVHLAALPPEEE
jgi:hypothetical protein